MKIDLISFFFGVILTLAVIIVSEHFYGKFFGNRKQKELAREVKRLQGIIDKKDELVVKSLKAMQDEEVKNEGKGREN